MLNQVAGFENFIFLMLVLLATAAQAYSQYRKREAMKETGMGDDEYDSSEREYVPEYSKQKERFDEEFYNGEENEPDFAGIKDKNKQAIMNTVVKEPGSIVKSNAPDTKTGKQDFVKPHSAQRIRKRLFTRGFSLKDAVIYSEIINRKYH